MKKILALSLLLMSAVVFVPSAEAKNITNVAANNVAEPQVRIQLGQNRRNRQMRNNRGRVRVVNQTRIVRFGRQRYRETIQIRYLPNGRTQTRVISRVRIR